MAASKGTERRHDLFGIFFPWRAPWLRHGSSIPADAAGGRPRRRLGAAPAWADGWFGAPSSTGRRRCGAASLRDVPLAHRSQHLRSMGGLPGGCRGGRMLNCGLLDRAASAARPGHLLPSARWQVRWRRVGRSGPRCAPPCPPDRPVTSLMLPDPNPALTLPSVARSPDLAAEPQAPFALVAARYFAAHMLHPCAQPACRTSTHSKTPLVGRSQLLFLILHHFPRAHFWRVSGHGGAAAVEGADPHSVQVAHQHA